MLEFFERAYYYELDRKTRIQTAIAYPGGVALVGIGALKYATENLLLSDWLGWVIAAAIIAGAVCLLYFLFQCYRFFLGHAYEYVGTMDEFDAHRRALEKFSAEFPRAPSAAETFVTQLQGTLAKCATHNACTNDRRSEILYRANAAIFVLILFSLLAAAIVSLQTVAKSIEGTRNVRRENPSSSAATSSTPASHSFGQDGRRKAEQP
jgi:hypothetical protein